MGRICEEFPALHPRTAYEEWLRAPVGLFERIVEYRAYAAAKAAYDAADTGEAKRRLPQTPLMDLVKAIEFQLMREEIDAGPLHD